MRLVLFCAFVLRLAQSLDLEPVSICGPQTKVHLEPRGDAASQTVVLELDSNKSVLLCRLNVTAPKSHVVNLNFLETDEPPRNNSEDKGKPPSCVMSIFLPDNAKTPFWKGDPCSGEKMPEVDLLTSEFKIVWNPPQNHTVVYQKTIVLTAVGSGPFCKDPFQHTCMRIGRIPMLCISDHLVCDGIQNCPKSSTNSDEDAKLCSTAKNAWENFVVELVKKYRPPDVEEKSVLKVNGSDVPTEWFEWQLVRKNVTKKPEVVNETHSATESISAMLNKYGPWGYLMMGLLICGTVLFFCGLWECCCKRPKPEGDTPISTTPTTVLIMNCEQGVANPMPPQYDDLDLPPSYTTLFPGDEGRYTSLSEEAIPSSSTEEEKNETIDQSLSVDLQSATVAETVDINDNDDVSPSQEQVTNSDSV